MIVTSILLAFGIDALWAQRQLRVEEREVLAALTVEFNTNLTALDRVLALHARNRGLVEDLVSLTEAEVRDLPQASISEMILALCNPATFDPLLGTTSALMSAGKLGVLRRPSLRESLTSFVNWVADAAEESGYMARNAEDVWRAEVELGGPWADPETEIIPSTQTAVATPRFVPRPSADDLLRVRTDRRFIGLVGRCHLNTGYYVEELGQVRVQIGSVLRGIDESG